MRLDRGGFLSSLVLKSRLISKSSGFPETVRGPNDFHSCITLWPAHFTMLLLWDPLTLSNLKRLPHDYSAIFSILKTMGGHISQKWYEFTIGYQEIDRYGWVYRLVIKNVDCYGWDYWLVMENADRYGWDCRLEIENDGCYDPNSDWILRLMIAMVERKIGVWKWSSKG